MKKLDRQILFLVYFPWVLAVWFMLKSPQSMLPALKSRVGIITITGLALWEFLGVKAARKFIKADDPRAWLKIVPFIVLFFFPVVFAVIFGPVVFQFYTGR